MAEYLDLKQWPRRDAYALFRDFEHPFFSVCTRVDAAPLMDTARSLSRAGTGSLTLALHFVALRLANAHAPFRWRLDGERVRVHPVVHASTTVLRDDDSFAFATLRHELGYADFCRQAAPAMAAARSGAAPFDAAVADDALIYFTTLPWLHFTSFAHARRGGSGDSIPRLAFGRIDAEGARRWLPLALDLHHALMDGLHAGRFVQAFEAALADPGPWLST